MNFDISLNAEETVTEKVTSKNTAAAYGSGLIEVYATPAMIALMEKASYSAVSSYLPEGFNTVGTEICVKHVKATPIDQEVWSKAVLVEVEGKKLKFEVTAWDFEGIIGSGFHYRYIINTEKFMKKVSDK